MRLCDTICCLPRSSDTWVQELRKLENQIPARSAAVVAQTILEETGRPMSETFASFDEVPLGSASIGQVHRATLKNGREVVVKVQYPDSARLFRKDMDTIRGFMSIFAPEQLFMLKGIASPPPPPPPAPEARGEGGFIAGNSSETL